MIARLWIPLLVILLWGLSCDPKGTSTNHEPTSDGSSQVHTEPLVEALPESAPSESAPSESAPEPQPEPTLPESQLEPQPEPQPEPTLPEPQPEPQPEAPPEPAFGFIAIGDTGTGSSTQKNVAMAIQQKCQTEKTKGRGCDFGILLGDNFYDVGVKDENDPQFKTKFADMYHPLGFPWYITQGNHDYGALGAGLEVWKTDHYIRYGKKDPLYVFPDKYFAFTKQHALFISLNTTELFFDIGESDQTKFVRDNLQNNKAATWRLAFGHHPYISNGEHGNAGEYEALPIPLPYVSGRLIKKFMEAEICGKFDIYFCGHDHNRQILQAKCGTQFIVSGAGAKSDSWGKGKKNPVHWQSDQVGFMFVYVKGRTLTVEALDENGTLEFSKTYTK